MHKKETKLAEEFFIPVNIIFNKKQRNKSEEQQNRETTGRPSERKQQAAYQ